jgi:hypothetical protein
MSPRLPDAPLPNHQRTRLLRIMESAADSANKLRFLRRRLRPRWQCKPTQLRVPPAHGRPILLSGCRRMRELRQARRRRVCALTAGVGPTAHRLPRVAATDDLRESLGHFLIEDELLLTLRPDATPTTPNTSNGRLASDRVDTCRTRRRAREKTQQKQDEYEQRRVHPR